MINGREIKMGAVAFLTTFAVHKLLLRRSDKEAMIVATAGVVTAVAIDKYKQTL